MSDFIQFRDLVNKNVQKLTNKNVPTFVVDLDKDDLWDTYLSAFPDGSNPMFRERTEHDCSCCKNFIRNVGNLVGIANDLTLNTVWDINIGGDYQVVADAMAALVKKSSIRSLFLTSEAKYGQINNIERLANGDIHQWEHFYADIPSHLRRNGTGVSLGQELGTKQATYGVLKRSITEITDVSVEIVLDLIQQNSIYRGSEFKHIVTDLKKAKKQLGSLVGEEQSRAMWLYVAKHGEAARYKNTVIGTLMEDLSDGVELEKAVASFESKVAPTNYKRSSSLVTQKMIDKANQRIQELGIESALQRRYAREDDITVNNVLFADRNSNITGVSVLDVLSPTKPTEINFDKVQEMTASEFIENVLPRAQSIEAYVENRHLTNLMSLIAPANPDAPNILKWDNNFSLTYNGDVTDAVKERVKREGGNLEADVRVSLIWYNYDDLDIHLTEPTNHTIYHGNRRTTSNCGGLLDVDMNAGGRGSREPVENITYRNKSTMKKGKYEVSVNQYQQRETQDFGFMLQVEIDGQITEYTYAPCVKGKQTFLVIESDGKGKVWVSWEHEALTSTSRSRQEWGLTTNQFVKVNSVMLSPNHWDDNATGNKHYLFMLDGCENPDDARGLYNEFLMPELNDDRKVFEVLGSKLRVPHSTPQMSGLGFSETVKNDLVLKVGGSFNRMIKVVF